MAKQSRCEDCMNYVYDEEYDCYTCEQDVYKRQPLFINEGDKIQIDTRTGEYMGRAK